MDKLVAFILSAQVSLASLSVRITDALTFYYQDTENGGIADRPGDMVDVFHTLFGVAGQSSLLFHR